MTPEELNMYTYVRVSNSHSFQLLSLNLCFYYLSSFITIFNVNNSHSYYRALRIMQIDV